MVSPCALLTKGHDAWDASGVAVSGNMTNVAVAYAPRPTDEEPTLLTMTFVAPCPGVLVAAVRGELDLASAPELDTKVRAELHRHRPRSLVLDLSGLEFLGVHGTAVFERLRRRCAVSEIRLSLVAVPPAGERALRFAGLLTRFDRHPDLGAALAAAGHVTDRAR